MRRFIDVGKTSLHFVTLQKCRLKTSHSRYVSTYLLGLTGMSSKIATNEVKEIFFIVL